MDKKEKKSRGLFFRIMSVSIICELLMLGMQMVMFSWATQVTREEIYNSAGVNTTYLRNQFEDSVSSIKTQIQYLLQYEDITSFFVYHQNYTNTELIFQAKTIFGLLSMIRDSNPLIQEIRLYYPRNDIGFIMGDAAKIEKTHYEDLAQRFLLSQTSNKPLQEIDGQYMILATLPTTLEKSKIEPAYYVEIVLKTESIRKSLSAYSSDKERYSLQYNHSTQNFLFGKGDDGASEWKESLRDIIDRIDQSESEHRMEVVLNGEDFTLISSYSSALNITYCQLLSTSDLERIPNFFRSFLIGIAALALITILFMSWSIRRQVSLPMRTLLHAFGIMGDGHFDQHINEKNYAWEFRALIQRFNEMNRQIQDLIITNYNHIINLQRAQLKQLQAQINPHFLYNSFFLLRQMVRDEDYSACVRFLGCLGEYFRYISENNEDTALFSEEYGHAKNYLMIQQTRFEDSLELDIQPIPEKMQSLEVLRLTLQPLFENIMTHCKWSDEAQRVIRMRIIENEKTIQLIVEDNGEGVTDEALQAISEHLNLELPIAETSGLDNIHRRLRLHYGESGGLTVKRSELGGFSVTMTLPNTCKGDMRNE